MLPSNPDKVETDAFLEIMGDEEFDRTLDIMKDAEQQGLLNIASTLVDQMDSSTAGSLGGLCLIRLDELDRMYPEVTGEALPEFDFEERAGRPGGRTYEQQCADEAQPGEQTQEEWEAMVCAAVDMMIETVTEGNGSNEDGQGGLCEAGQLLVPYFDMINCSYIGDQCRDREKELLAEDRRAGLGTGFEDEAIETCRQELQEAIDAKAQIAEARGEPGPLDKEPEPDVDYFEIAKEIRKRAAAYNSAVLKAEIDAGINVTVKILAGHAGMIDLSGTDIKLEMSL